MQWHEVRQRLSLVSVHRSAAAAFLTVSGCSDPLPPPPPGLIFNGVPVSGSLEVAHGAGFTACFNADAAHVRCRRAGVMLLGQGPYQGAVDLNGGRGEGGFRGVTLWHDRDQYAVYKVRDALKNQGWHYCYTGEGFRGDQAIFAKDGVPIRIWMDLSYWGKRRLRILPIAGGGPPACEPDRLLIS